MSGGGRTRGRGALLTEPLQIVQPMNQRAKKSFTELVVGKAKDPLDPKVFHQISLVAFLAWVGLGADGLSSSAYGPEEAYLALGQHLHLALVLAILTAVTVFIISASYSQIIEMFPTGGGGYLVATKLLGSRAGLISGSALVIDYMLTITISIASSADALFSFFPAPLSAYKFAVEVLLIFALILLNLRGVRESVLFLLPIFLLFIVMHLVVITLGIVPHAGDMPALVANTYAEVSSDVQGLGLLATLGILLRAYSLGGGTYTGIEAVSNGLQILREPRVVTGKKTMLYMATSLALTAGGILLCYLLNRVIHEPGKTLNASLFANIYGAFFGGDFDDHGDLGGRYIDHRSSAVDCRRAGGISRRPTGLIEHVARFLGAASVVAFERSAGHAQRRLVYGHRGTGLFGLHPRRGETVGGHVQHQCVFDLYLVPVGHVPALVAGAPVRRALAHETCGKWHRVAVHQYDSVRHRGD